MAYLRFGNRIVDKSRKWGRPERFEYSMGKGMTAAKMKRALRAHDEIRDALSPQQAVRIDTKQMRSIVERYLLLSPGDRPQFLRDLVIYDGKQPDRRAVDLLAEYCEGVRPDLTETGRAELTSIERVLVEWMSLFRIRTPEDLTRPRVQDFVRWRSTWRHPSDIRTGPVSAKMVNRAVLTIRRFCTWLKDYDFLRGPNPADGVRARAVPGESVRIIEPLDENQLRSLLSALRDHGTEWAHDATLLLLVTGARCGDVQELIFNPHWLDIENGLIQFHAPAVGGRSRTGKTSSATRTVPAPPTVLEIARRGHIWKDSQRFRERVGRYLARFCKAQELPHTHPHRLRHTHATMHILGQTRRLEELSYYLGHRSIQTTTDIYHSWLRQEMARGRDVVKKRYADLVNWLESDYFMKDKTQEK